MKNKYWTILWMFGGMIFLSDVLAAEELPIAEYRPVWVVGQKWVVEVEKLTEPRNTPEDIKQFEPKKFKSIYRFEVEGEENAGGELCVRIRIESGSEKHGPFDHVVFYRVLFRKADCTLQSIQRWDGRANRAVLSREFVQGPVDATDLVGFLPLAMPFFSSDKPDPTPKRSKVNGQPDQIWERIAFAIKGSGKDAEALRCTVKTKDGNMIAQETALTWLKGLPWWVEARQERKGFEWCTARLVRDRETNK